MGTGDGWRPSGGLVVWENDSLQFSSSLPSSRLIVQDQIRRLQSEVLRGQGSNNFVESIFEYGMANL